jgi:hypothetical protein
MAVQAKARQHKKVDRIFMALRVGAGWNHLNGIGIGSSSPDQKLVLDSKQDNYHNGIFKRRNWAGVQVGME